MTKFGQTHDYSASDHINEVTRYCGKKPDVVLIHNRKLPRKILKAYEGEHAYPVDDDLDKHFPDITNRIDLASTKVIPKVKGDKINRSIIRHDSKKIANVLYEIISSH